MRIALPAAIAAAVISCSAASAQDWTNRVTLYAWAPTVTTELQNNTEIVADRWDLLQNLEGALAGEFVTFRGDWMYGAEIFYSRIGDERSLSFPVSSGEPDSVDEIRGTGSAEVSTTMLQGFAGYKLVDRPDGAFWGTVGLRYASIDAELEVETDVAAFSVDADGNLLDATVGVRGFAVIDENWSIPLIIDAGAGDSRFTFQMFGGLTYTSGQNSFTLGYRKLEWLLPDSNEYLNKVVYQGPVLSYSRWF